MWQGFGGGGGAKRLQGWPWWKVRAAHTEHSWFQPALKWLHLRTQLSSLEKLVVPLKTHIRKVRKHQTGRNEGYGWVMCAGCFNLEGWQVVDKLIPEKVFPLRGCSFWMSPHWNRYAPGMKLSLVKGGERCFPESYECFFFCCCFYLLKPVIKHIL